MNDLILGVVWTIDKLSLVENNDNNQNFFFSFILDPV